jgi:HPr kinase/phosphorylase
MSNEQSPTLHACCLLLDDLGILIQGPSGSGKSTLTLKLIDRWRHMGRYASLVADDRTYVSAHFGRVLARCPPSLHGQIEVRGAGILHFHSAPSARLSVVLNLITQVPERIPNPYTIELCGVELPRLDWSSTSPFHSLCAFLDAYPSGKMRHVC